MDKQLLSSKALIRRTKRIFRQYGVKDVKIGIVTNNTGVAVTQHNTGSHKTRVAFDPLVLFLKKYSYVDEIIRHELAHVLDFKDRNLSDHGPIWGKWAAKTKAPLDAYISFKHSGRYEVHCKNCGKLITKYPVLTREKADYLINCMIHVACGFSGRVRIIDAYTKGIYEG